MSTDLCFFRVLSIDCSTVKNKDFLVAIFKSLTIGSISANFSRMSCTQHIFLPQEVRSASEIVLYKISSVNY